MGQAVVRTRFLDYDGRRNPKTKRFCVKCQKDLKAKPLVRRVYIVNFIDVVHPEDIENCPDGEWFLIGNDCAKTLGMEYTLSE